MQGRTVESGNSNVARVLIEWGLIGKMDDWSWIGRIFLGGWLCMGSLAGAEGEGEWESLFDGETLEGWTFDVLDGLEPGSIFGARDGVILVRGEGRSKAVMRTEEDFEDYELRLEWRWPGEPGNSGCLLHCSEPRFLSVWPKSLEVQLGHGNAGDLIEIGETVVVPKEQMLVNPEQEWKVRLRLNLTDNSEKPVGEWNALRVVVDDGVVKVWVNGDLVNRGTEVSADSGAIALQAEGADIEFRGLRIREL